MPIGNEAIVSILIRQLKRDGFDHIIIASGYLGELMESYLGDGSKYGVTIEYSREDKPLGTAGPLTLIDNLDDTFLMVNGDTLCTLDFDALTTTHQQMGSAATIGTYKKFVKIDLGVLHFDDDLSLKEYVEKPEYTFDISMGIYVLNRDVVGHIPKDERFDLPDLMRNLVSNHISVLGYRLEGEWYDIGRVEDYALAQEAYQKNPDHFFVK